MGVPRFLLRPKGRTNCHDWQAWICIHCIFIRNGSTLQKYAQETALRSLPSGTSQSVHWIALLPRTWVQLHMHIILGAQILAAYVSVILLVYKHMLEYPLYYYLVSLLATDPHPVELTHTSFLPGESFSRCVQMKKMCSHLVSYPKRKRRIDATRCSNKEKGK